MERNSYNIEYKRKLFLNLFRSFLISRSIIKFHDNLSNKLTFLSDRVERILFTCNFFHEEEGGGEGETGGNEVSSELSKEEMVPYLSSSIIRRPRGILI